MITRFPKTARLGNSPHVFHHYGTAVGEDHRQTHGAWRDPPSAELLRINHYYSRSIGEYERKRARPRAFSGQVGDSAELPRDEVRDGAVLRFVPALRDALAPHNRGFGQERDPGGSNLRRCQR